MTSECCQAVHTPPLSSPSFLMRFPSFLRAPHSCMGPQPGGEALRPENLSRTFSGASSLRSFTWAPQARLDD